MDPEEEFLENAATLLRYAKEELKQFLTWTDKQAAYGQKAKALVQQIDGLAVQMKELQKAYKVR
ncbi:hypothetical protein H8B13_09830 [Hymenobacter sp. BT188]|uniref:hypothetical protein n=1 Tax=Hymenobacter sp. BT188 TaxID=2763504 RepID=UPI001651874B|nr:hypothetical protein [Hymenobacter sp. BT188]MBC6607118.1 hypothetical protein [Hymenobacter sp. BT188]